MSLQATCEFGNVTMRKWFAWDDRGIRHVIWAKNRKEAKNVAIQRFKVRPGTMRMEEASDLLEQMAEGWQPPSRHEAEEGVNDVA